MLIHGNARLVPRQRVLMCERVRHEGWTVYEAAEAFGVSTRTVFRWLARFDQGKGLHLRILACHDRRHASPTFASWRRRDWSSRTGAAAGGCTT